MGALTVVVPDLIMAGAPVVARLYGAVVDVDATVAARPSVDADARVVAVRDVHARRSVLADIGRLCTFVYVLFAVLTCKKNYF